MKIAVLVSGGVDSSVALAQLKKQGHEVTAFYLKIWLDDELSHLGDCPWEQDLSFVRQTCQMLQVPLEVINLQREYHERIVSYTIQQIRQGHTPNPDMLCNQQIKFGLFLETIDPSYEKVATGHYAQIVHHDDGHCELRCAPDTIKDQTYFLARLSQQQLSRVLFPIGHLDKNQVRELACQWNLPTARRPDSQGICFLGQFKFADFVRYHLGEQTGDLVEFETGQVLGKHPGFWFYTIGQRQGIRLSGGPWYVVAKNPANNVIFISRSYYAPDKKRDSLQVAYCQWLDDVPIEETLKVKLRHGPQMHTACVRVDRQKDTAYLTLVDNDQGIAPGQFVVFYRGDRCIGSAVIT